MFALIDGDILPYECGGLRKRPIEPDEEDFCPDVPEGELLPFELCWSACQNKIQTILEATNADDYCIFLSHPKIKTWRYERATIKPYKGTRPVEKPPYYQNIIDNIKLVYKYEEVEFIEADDAMSIRQYQDVYSDPYDVAEGKWSKIKKSSRTVICSRDKDLNMVPGWHYSWATGRSPEKPMWWQNETEGLRCFYKQLLTGDTVDNIPGLFGVGEKSALVRKIDLLNTDREMFSHVFSCYQDRFGSYARQFLLENGQLLWMQRTREDRWDPWTDGRMKEWVIRAAQEEQAEKQAEELAKEASA